MPKMYKVPTEKLCDFCRQPFKTIYRDTIFCSHPCAGTAGGRPPTALIEQRNCVICNKPFVVKQFRHDKFCSLECAYKGRIYPDEEWRAELFWSRVDKNGPIPEHCPERGPCWIYTGPNREYYADHSYGQYWHAWRLIMGPREKDGLWMNHHCDNKRCVKVDPDPAISHIYLGTRQQDIQDMYDRGRSFLPTAALIREIRATWPNASETMNLIDFAHSYGILERAMDGILSGRTYRRYLDSA